MFIMCATIRGRLFSYVFMCATIRHTLLSYQFMCATIRSRPLSCLFMCATFSNTLITSQQQQCSTAPCEEKNRDAVPWSDVSDARIHALCNHAIWAPAHQKCIYMHILIEALQLYSRTTPAAGFSFAKKKSPHAMLVLRTPLSHPGSKIRSGPKVGQLAT